MRREPLPSLETLPQIRSAPDCEITGRPNSPPPELLKFTIVHLALERNATIEGGYGTKELLAKCHYFGTILQLRLVTCQPLLVLDCVSGVLSLRHPPAVPNLTDLIPSVGRHYAGMSVG